MTNNTHYTVHIPESCQNGVISHTAMDSCISTSITIATDGHIHNIKFIKSVCCIEESLAGCLLCSGPFLMCICADNACFQCAKCCSKAPLTRTVKMLDGVSKIKKIEHNKHGVDVYVSKAYDQYSFDIYQFRSHSVPMSQLMI